MAPEVAPVLWAPCCGYLACDLQVIFVIVFGVASKSKPRRRSGCPVSLSLERFGDRWSLLIVRDLMVRGYRTFGEFRNAGEGIATNILAARLKTLEVHGIINSEKNPDDGRAVHYRLTEKGIDLAPALLEMLIWGARHEDAKTTCGVIDYLEKNRDSILRAVRTRWAARDTSPILPKFDDKAFGHNSPRRKS
jgi:DNA-binding HxlR family transcriptional regulator